MRVLVVFCHPAGNSLGAALHAAAVDGLASAGHEVIDVDLYREGFSPALSKAEFLTYRDEARNTSLVKPYVDQLSSVDGVVFVYPSWWYTWPAMLKGYIDRVWLPGVAFDIVGGQVERRRLGHIRQLAMVTTFGSPWWLVRLYVGDPTRKLVTRGLKPLCARKCRVAWFVKYGLDSARRPALAAFIERVREGMAKL